MGNPQYGENADDGVLADCGFGISECGLSKDAAHWAVEFSIRIRQ